MGDAMVDQFKIVFCAPDEFKELYDEELQLYGEALHCALDPWNASLNCYSDWYADNHVNERFTVTNLKAETYCTSEIVDSRHLEAGYWSCVTNGLNFMPCDFILSELEYHPPTTNE